ncbi:MAG TPA: nitrilase-related carbon-nitrogen hydrolase [Baekduia sp.]|nr:nitrilase-related carbon-nitrogen hydrolase [Baekduia sp.]
MLDLRARALENTVWVAGSGAVGTGVTGRSAIIDPLGVVRAELDECSDMTTVLAIDVDRTAAARRALPILAQRKAAYGSLVAGSAASYIPPLG